MWVIKNFGILWNGRPCKVDLHCSFINLVRIFISGTCSFAAARFNSGLPVRDSIRIFKGLSSPSACNVVMRKPRCRYYMYTSLKALYISRIMLFMRWLKNVKYIFWINALNTGILFTKKMLHVRNTSVCSFMSSTEIFTWSLATTFGFLQVILSFIVAIYLSYTFWETSTSLSWTITGNLLIWLPRITQL